MKKIIVGSIIVTLLVSSVTTTIANHHGEMMDNHAMEDMNSDYGIFTSMVRSDLTDSEKLELMTLLEQQKMGMEMAQEMVKDIQAGELDKYEAVLGFMPKRMAMAQKLIPYMKDENEFKAFCMKHGGQMIGKVFANAELVKKYTMIFENKLGDKIQAIQEKHGMKLQMLIHKNYKKLIEAESGEKIFSKLRALEIALGNTAMKVSADMMYGDVTEFIKIDLSGEEKEALISLLEDRKNAQAKIKKMLTEAKENGTLEEALEKVREMRKTCQGRFAPFIAEDQKDAFSSHCKIMGETLESKFAN